MAERRMLTLPERGAIDGRGRAVPTARPARRPLSPILWVVVFLAGHVSIAAETLPNRPGYLPVQSGAAISDPMTSDAMRSDARLSDVCFVDPQFGWAVGDRGTIWHTENGGRDWHLQQSGVRYGFLDFPRIRLFTIVFCSERPHDSIGDVTGLLAPRMVFFVQERQVDSFGLSTPRTPAGRVETSEL